MAESQTTEFLLQPVEIKGSSGSSSTTAKIEVWTPQRRSKMGLKYWGISWLLIVPAIFLPIVHFVLVPLLLIMGPVFFFIYRSKKTMVIGGEGVCPDCQGAVHFDKQELQWPFAAVCEKNYDHLKVFEK